MKDLFHQILNSTASLGYYIKRLEKKDKIEAEKLVKKIEQALIRYKARCNGTDTYKG